MKYVLIALIVLMSWGQPAAAFTFTTSGAGNIICGKYTKESRKDGALHWQNEQWVLGYVTPATIYLRRDPMGGTDIDGQAIILAKRPSR